MAVLVAGAVATAACDFETIGRSLSASGDAADGRAAEAEVSPRTPPHTPPQP